MIHLKIKFGNLKIKLERENERKKTIEITRNVAGRSETVASGY